MSVPRKLRSKWIIGAMVVLLIVGLVVGGWFFFKHRSPTTTTATSQPSATLERHQMPQSDVQYLEHALNSPDKATQNTAIVSGLREDYDKQNQSLLPPGTTVKIDPTTFESSGDYGQVTAAVSSQGSTKLHLVRQNGKWLIFYTEKVK